MPRKLEKALQRRVTCFEGGYKGAGWRCAHDGCDAHAHFVDEGEFSGAEGGG